MIHRSSTETQDSGWLQSLYHLLPQPPAILDQDFWSTVEENAEQAESQGNATQDHFVCNTTTMDDSMDVYVQDQKGTSGRHALIDRSEY